MTNVFYYSDIITQILSHLPDVRLLLTLNKAVYYTIIKSEDYAFWSQHTLSDQNIMSYGPPKMLQLVNDIQGSISYANYNLNMLKHLKELKVNMDNNHMLIFASQYGQLEVVQYLVSVGANIYADTDHAVRFASENGHLEVVQYLVSVGADIRADSDYAVRLASANGHLEVVKYLVSVGADIHTDDDWAVRMANRGGHLEVVQYLVRLGANI
jgi:hypothetical protein